MALRPWAHTTASTRYSYAGAGDTPDLSLDTNNTVIERTLNLAGGVLVTKRSGGDVWSYPNIHGDMMATVDAAGTLTAGPLAYDPYGQAINTIPDNSAGNYDYGWLGQHQRGVDTQAGNTIIQMGARAYSPRLGRFLEVDPIEGGSDNDYDYVGADPINALDLDGLARRCAKWAMGCKGAKFGRGALHNRYVRGGAAILIVGAACAGIFTCVLGGMAVGSALRAVDYTVNSKRHTGAGLGRALLLGSEEGGLALTAGFVRGALLTSVGAYSGRRLAHGTLSTAARLARYRWFPNVFGG